MSSNSASPTLQALVTFLTAPFSALPTTDSAYKQSFEHLLSRPLSIPLLPNRLHSSSALGPLSARLPLPHLDKADPFSIVDDIPTLEGRVHLLANLCTFVPVSRISSLSSLSGTAVNIYVRLLALLINSLPPNALESLQTNGNDGIPPRIRDEDADSDLDHNTQVLVVDSFQPKVKLPQLDARTLTRVQTIRSPSYINVILASMQHHRVDQASLFAWGIALCNVWPNRKGEILGFFVVYGGGGLVRELYRGYVRTSSIGQDPNPASLTGSYSSALPHNLLTVSSGASLESSWPPFLFLVELYTQALLTMGDDEFFSTGASSGGARNPLSLDELITFSKKLLNVAFTLYWREGQSEVQTGGPPGVTGVKWDVVREKVTKCLQAIHTRE